MRSIEEGVIRQTGKPPLIVDDGKAPQAVPYSPTDEYYETRDIRLLCADCHERCAVHTTNWLPLDPGLI